MADEKDGVRVRRHKGLLPMSGPELEVVHSIGLTETDIRDMHAVIMAASYMPLHKQFVLVCRILAHRGIRKPSPFAPSPRSRPASGNGSSSETLAKLDAAVAQTRDSISSSSSPLRVRR